MVHRSAWVLGLLTVLVLAAFWGHWKGDFVYDDVSQIRGNGLIRSGSGTLEAMTRDVWGFKGDKAEAWSNYWRPVFVAWLALNYRLFGLDSTVGWHWAVVGLHLVATWLGFLLLRRAGLGAGVSLAAAAVFAVHPAHVESVAWISGSPDPLVACLLLGSLLVLPRDGSPRPSGRWLACLGLYLLALLTKEIAVLGALLVLALDHARLEPTVGFGRRLARAAPFAALAMAYAGVRRLVLGFHEVLTPWQPDALEVALTAPRLLLFYLRQTVLPLELGPAYPLRAASAADPGALVGAAAVLLLAVGAILGAARLRRRPRLLLCLALFVLPLLPALNIRAFLPESLVHDRYLYLPLLGGWGAILLLARRALDALPRGWRSPLALLVMALVTGGLAAQTLGYVPAWRTEAALWRRGVEVDPRSAFNWSQHGHALAATGREREALDAFQRSLAITENGPALMGRAQMLVAMGRLDGARADLLRLVTSQPANTGAIERLAQVLQRTGELDLAARVLRQGREVNAHRYCELTGQLGVILYLQGDRPRALAELEAARRLVRPESLVPCHLSLFQLGVLYGELGREAEGRDALREFLAVTERSPDATVLDRRRRAARLLAGSSS